MLLIRLLAIFLVLITNTWLLSPVRSDALSRYKRDLARRADRELSRLAGEPCTVSGVRSSHHHRQPRALSPSQHRPPAARPRTHTSLAELYAAAVAQSAPAVCAGGCSRGDTGAHRAEEEKKKGAGRGGDAEDVTVRGAQDGYAGSEEKRFTSAERRARSPRRRVRSVDARSSWEKVYRDESTDPRGLQVLHRLQQHGAGNNQRSSSTGTVVAVEDGAGADYSSGEVVEEASAPVGSASPPPWGSPVLRVVPPSWMSTLYFSGRREQLKLKPNARVELPRDKFSLELWVKPEGGQSNPAVIAGGCSLILSASIASPPLKNPPSS